MRAATRDGTVAGQTLLAHMEERVDALLTFMFQAYEAVQTRDILRDEVVRLRNDLRNYRNLEQENRLLRRMLGLQEASSHKLRLARVIARGGVSGWWQSVRINRGREDGVRPNMAVITADGLVGRTTTVTRRTCDVLLITDPSHRIACRLARTGELGVARGRGAALSGRRDIEMVAAAEPCTMDYVDKDADIMAGDKVVTSGLGGTYPGDLVVGTVLTSAEDDSRLYQYLTVRPAADLARLHYVWVVYE